jgi:hypothetical protein
MEKICGGTTSANIEGMTFWLLYGGHLGTIPQTPDIISMIAI